MEIPKGISFGSKVLVLPGYLGGFTHSGYMNKYSKKRNYRWIKRGEPIAEFVIRGSYYNSLYSRLFNTEEHSVVIKSPVSGLGLHQILSTDSRLERDSWLKDSSNPPYANYAILLPDDEPPPQTGEYMYSSMCNFIMNMKHYYFKDSRYWTMKGFFEEHLKDMIKIQLSANPIKFDALPNWKDYLNEARTNFPELRPHLKHLAVLD